MTNTQQRIVEVCDSVRELLLQKNRKYGDSALNPSRIFAKSDAVEQIKVRIDDKLSRISTSGTSGVDEDTLQDLIGYLVLLKIATEQVTEQVPFVATYEDILQDEIHAASEGKELLAEYGLADVDDQPLPGWDSDEDYMWDPSLGPVELSDEEVQDILSKKSLDQFEDHEIVQVIEKRGMVLGVMANGNTCVLGANGKCE